MRNFILPVLFIGLLSGCATYYNNTFQKIAIHTPGVQNVECNLVSEKNQYVVLAPNEVTVDRSPLPITITCEKAGYVTFIQTIKPVAYLGDLTKNVYNGFLPGIIYDVGSESIYWYPKTIIINMKPVPKKIGVAVKTKYVVKNIKEKPKQKPKIDPVKSNKVIKNSLVK